MKTMLKHKGYYGEVYYSDEDECYVGMVIGIRGMIACHGDTITQAQNELIDSINHYLNVCEEEGWRPNVTDPQVALEMEKYFKDELNNNLHVIPSNKRLALVHLSGVN